MSDRTPNKPKRREVGSGALARFLGAPIRVAAAVLLRLAIPIGALSALSAAALLVFAAIEGNWLIASFEVVVIWAGVVAMLTGMGRFRQGPGLALLCAGGTIGSMAVLAEPALVSHFLGTPGKPLVIGGFKILPLMMGRVFGGVLLVAGAAFVVWARDAARSAGYLIRAGLAGGAALLIGFFAAWPAPKGGARTGVLGILDRVPAMLSSLPMIVLVILAIAAFFLVIGLVSAAGHCAIRSLEVGGLGGGESEKAGPENGAGAAISGNPPRA